MGCGGTALAAGHSVSSKTFVLKRSDVPAAFDSKFNFSQPISTSQALSRYRVKLATLTREGRVDGYESAFSRPYDAKNTPKGLYGVADEVSQYSSTSGAHWFFNRLKKKSYLGKTSTVPAVGDERVASDTPEVKGSRYAKITFRHGDFVVTVSTSSVGTSDPLPDAVHYARIIDHRLTAHGQ